DQTIHGTVITSMTECVSGVSHFEGTDTNNNTFIVDVADNADPGTGDTFQISGTDQNGLPYGNGPKFAPRHLGGGRTTRHRFTSHLARILASLYSGCEGRHGERQPRRDVEVTFPSPPHAASPA